MTQTKARLWSVGVVASVLLATAAIVALGQVWRGEWELRPGRSADAVRLELRQLQFGRGMSTTLDVQMSELRGFSPGILSGSGPAKFEYIHDAGRLIFEGAFRSGAGSGTFTFEPDPDFPRELERLGYDAPSLDRRRHLSMVFLDVNLDFARAVRDAGFHASAQELIELRVHGVTPEYMKALQDAGYSGLRVEEITRLRIHGVQPDFIQEARRLGHNFTPPELVELRIHGVNAAYLQRLQDAGMRNLTASEIARLRIHGVD